MAPALRDRLGPGIAPWDSSRNSSKRIQLLYNASMMVSDTVGPCRPRCRPCLDSLADVTPRDSTILRDPTIAAIPRHIFGLSLACCIQWGIGMWPCTGVGNSSVEGVSHTEVVQAPHVPPHTTLELPMVQLCPCLSHGIAGAGAASTSLILWALMQGKASHATTSPRSSAAPPYELPWNWVDLPECKRCVCMSG